jgi:hypothetical protein
MLYNKDIDSTLDFNDYDSQPILIRNAMVVEDRIIPAAPFCDPADNVTAYVAHKRMTKDRFGEFGTEGGKAAKGYSSGASRNLHHQTEYCPCRKYTREEIEALGYDCI